MQVSALILEYIRTLAWPFVVVLLSLVFRKDLRAVIGRVRKAELPGVAFDFGEEIREAKIISARVETAPPPQKKREAPAVPRTEANARILSLGLQPSPSGINLGQYRDVAAQDPALALAGLRVEVDVLTRNLVRGFGLPIEDRESVAIRVRRLLEGDAITTDQAALIRKILDLSNAAVHGRPVSYSEALAVIDIAEVLAAQYLDWLSWGFSGNWTPQAGSAS